MFRPLNGIFRLLNGASDDDRCCAESPLLSGACRRASAGRRVYLDSSVKAGVFHDGSQQSRNGVSVCRGERGSPLRVVMGRRTYREARIRVDFRAAASTGSARSASGFGLRAQGYLGFPLTSTPPVMTAPSAIRSSGEEISPFTDPVARRSTLTLPVTAPLMMIVCATRSALIEAPAPIVRL